MNLDRFKIRRIGGKLSSHVKKTRTLTDMTHAGHLKIVPDLILSTAAKAAQVQKQSDNNSHVNFTDTQSASNTLSKESPIKKYENNVISIHPNSTALTNNQNNETPKIQQWGDVPEWAYSATRSILEALKKVDPETYHHCVRVGEYSRLLAKAAGLNEYEQKIAEFSGLLHDVGKMGISQEIVHKPGKLDEHEYLTMKNHSVYSEEIVRPLEKHLFFKQVNPCVRAHHERVDGQGYPDKLAGEEIPVISRVILIVDTMDAMGQDRAYRKGLPIERIYNEIKKFAGTQFDASLARIFLESHQYWSKESREPTTYQEIVLKVA